MNVSEELARLAQLRDQGVLTQDEFEVQKAAVLRGDHPATPAARTEGKGKSKLGMGCLAVLGILVLLIAIGSLGGGNKGAKVEAPSGDGSPVAAVEDAAPEAKLSMDGYNRLRNGMTFKQVTAIVGEPSQELSRNEIAGTETVMYMWEGNFGANMNAMFQNGKMVQKAQLGLK